MDTSKNPNFIPTAALLKNFLASICAIDTLLRSSRLREMALAVIPAPDGFAAPCHDRICGAAEIFSRLAFGRTLNFLRHP